MGQERGVVTFLFFFEEGSAKPRVSSKTKEQGERDREVPTKGSSGTLEL